MSTQYYFMIRITYILFIGSASDYKPTIIHKMSAESFCCFPILKIEEALKNIIPSKSTPKCEHCETRFT